MQGMVAGKRSNGKPRQIWENTSQILYVWYDGSSEQSGGEHASFSQRQTYRREERDTFETRPIVLMNSVLNETDPFTSATRVAVNY